jgi:hypothetical protein
MKLNLRKLKKLLNSGEYKEIFRNLDYKEQKRFLNDCLAWGFTVNVGFYDKNKEVLYEGKLEEIIFKYLYYEYRADNGLSYKGIIVREITQ